MPRLFYPLAIVAALVALTSTHTATAYTIAKHATNEPFNDVAADASGALSADEYETPVTQGRALSKKSKKSKKSKEERRALRRAARRMARRKSKGKGGDDDDDDSSGDKKGKKKKCKKPHKPKGDDDDDDSGKGDDDDDSGKGDDDGKLTHPTHAHRVPPHSWRYARSLRSPLPHR